VTKRATATIDLKKAVAVEDLEDARKAQRDPKRGLIVRSDSLDEFDGLRVDKSFRLIFKEDEIVFFADSEADKSQWYVFNRDWFDCQLD
jgi:hypothetical protein